ncbi:poly [Trichoderma arundinaceum]|uniref:Poly n=1 Tax=Trichoderma arundinaceum TaxID=490622 RepID=A0A395NQK6_TRIAR|nr:poly [Trichoderma arundinaceum]
MFDPTKEIEIETDASDFAIGGKLHKPELRYPIYDKELMAIVEAFREWRHYCHGSLFKIKVFTDNRNIIYFATTQVLSKRQIRYLEFLAQFDYQIIHCKGTENGRADALSRKKELFQETPEIVTQNEQGHYEQKTFAATYRFEEYNPVNEEIKEYVQNWNQKQFPEESSLHNGLPILNDKIWVPDKLRKKVVKAIHVHPLHGHNGIRRMKEQVQRYYTIDGIKKQIHYRNHGLPGEMISDRGSTFVFKFRKALTARLGTHLKASTAHHPQTDGQTERIYQILKDYLVHYIDFGMDDWVEKLPIAQFAYNSTQSESTGKSPFYLNFGFEPEAYRLPREGEDVEKAIIQADDMKK